MKVIDLHADIGCDVLARKHQHQSVFCEQHVPKLITGEIEGIISASFFSGIEDWAGMQNMILQLESELLQQQHYPLICAGSQLTGAFSLMSVEGMCGIKEEVESKIQWLYDHHIRIASLQWNEENALSTGVKGNSNRGLSELGKRVIHKMDELHMVIDVSHCNEQSFYDTFNESKGLVIATHSNCYALCPHPRNLKDEQIKLIASRDGLIGMNSCAYFVTQEASQATALELAKHAKYIKDLVGVEVLACGFDYMDFFAEVDDCMMPDLGMATQTQNFVQALADVGFTEVEIQRVCYQNVLDKFSGYIR